MGDEIEIMIAPAFICLAIICLAIFAPTQTQKCTVEWWANVSWGSDIYVGSSLKEAQSKANGQILYSTEYCRFVDD